MGIEPMTAGLQDQRSATELQRLRSNGQGKPYYEKAGNHYPIASTLSID